MQLKVGDKVRVRQDLVAGKKYGHCTLFNKSMEKYKGEITTIQRVWVGIYQLESNTWYWTDEMLEPVETPPITEENLSAMMRSAYSGRRGGLPYAEYTFPDPFFKTSFNLSIKKPIMAVQRFFKRLKLSVNEKAFQKAEITNEDNDFTDQGREVFLQFLLGIHQEAFKTEVVDPILKELESKD